MYCDVICTTTMVFYTYIYASKHTQLSLRFVRNHHPLCLFVCVLVPSTARSFRDGTPIYCPLRRTRSSVNSPFPLGIEPGPSRDSPLRYRCATPAPSIPYVFFPYVTECDPILEQISYPARRGRYVDGWHIKSCLIEAGTFTQFLYNLHHHTLKNKTNIQFKINGLILSAAASNFPNKVWLFSKYRIMSFKIKYQLSMTYITILPQNTKFCDKSRMTWLEKYTCIANASAKDVSQRFFGYAH